MAPSQIPLHQHPSPNILGRYFFSHMIKTETVHLPSGSIVLSPLCRLLLLPPLPSWAPGRALLTPTGIASCPCGALLTPSIRTAQLRGGESPCCGSRDGDPLRLTSSFMPSVLWKGYLSKFIFQRIIHENSFSDLLPGFSLW